MKKHLVLIMNIVLVAAVIGAIVFTLIRVLSPKPTAVEPAETVAATQSVTEAATLAPGERYKVSIIQHGPSDDGDACYAGFISQLKKRGLLDSLDIVYIVEADDEKCTSEIKRVVEEGCDLIYTIGPFASKTASDITKDIPIVFAGVKDPEETGLVESNEAPGGNVTGVSSYTPCFEQIDLIPVLLPQTKTVASLYSATNEASVRQAIIASKEAEDFRYTAERYPVKDAKELQKALSDIKDKGIDVIYLPIDKMIYRNMDAICEFSYANKVPIITGNEIMMKAGGLATCEINYNSIGKRSADLSYDVLFGKKDPASLPVIYKYDCHNLVNKEVLEKLGIKLSDVAKANVTIMDYNAEPSEGEAE